MFENIAVYGMLAQHVFFSWNVVLFFAVIQYAVLGLYNLIRLNMNGTAIDYYALRVELTFSGGLFVLSVILMSWGIQNERISKYDGYKRVKGNEEKGDSNREKKDGDVNWAKQALFDVCIVGILVFTAIVAFLAQTLFSCYTGFGKNVCGNTWRGDYRIGFVIFYILSLLCMMSSLEFCLRRLPRSEFSKHRRSTHAFVFFCMYAMLLDHFYKKSNRTCSEHMTFQSFDTLVFISFALGCNFALELLYYNRFKTPNTRSRVDIWSEFQVLLHVLVYVGYILTFKGIVKDAVTIVVTVFLLSLDIISFFTRLYQSEDSLEENKKIM